MAGKLSDTDTDPLLAEQVAYYRAIAPEYEDHTIAEPGADALLAAFDAFPVAGDVLEFACGPGIWTERLLARATALTAIDAATIRRRLKDGTPYRAVKVVHRAPDLQRALTRLGWSVEVSGTEGPFYWGAGTRARARPNRQKAVQSRRRHQGLVAPEPFSK